MRSKSSPLLPVFRSQHQADLLALLLLHPEQEYTVTELAKKLDVPLTTVHQEVRRLVDAGLLASRSVGRSSLIRVNSDHRAVPPLTELIRVTFGPHVVVEEEFGELDGAELVLVFGSWAARYAGQPGPQPNDIDVLVVGDVTRADVYDAAERAEERLAIPVNPVLRSTARWHAADDPLVQQILSAPSVTVIDHRTNKGVGR